MGKRLLTAALTILASLALFGLLCFIHGCTTEQQARVTKALTDANTVTTAIHKETQGPAGSVLPAPVGLGAGLAALLTESALLWWLKNKDKLLKTSSSAVVKAVETLPPDVQAAVKQAVAAQMETQAANAPSLTYDMMNRVIDSLKV